MSKYSDDINLKLAWQTAYELRTCPDSDTLQASQTDKNLQMHLDICHVCRDKREMHHDERSAWSALREKFATLAMTPGSGTDKQAGQVWTINGKFGGWREDGRFMKPPAVLLLEKIESTSGWKVSQLYSDKRLMGSGDVALNESFGFAQSWNCYSLKDDRFDKFLGAVKPEELLQVIAESVAVHESAAEGSILSFFRGMEIEVGAFVAVAAVEELVEEWESAIEEAVELIPGLKLLMKGAKEFVLDVTADALALLNGTFKPAMVTRGKTTPSTAAKLSDEQKKLIRENCPVVPVNMKVDGHTLTITLKWLQELPIDVPEVKVLLNGKLLEAAKISSDAIYIMCTDDRIYCTNNRQQDYVVFTYKFGCLIVDVKCNEPV